MSMSSMADLHCPRWDPGEVKDTACLNLCAGEEPPDSGGAAAQTAAYSRGAAAYHRCTVGASGESVTVSLAPYAARRYSSAGAHGAQVQGAGTRWDVKERVPGGTFRHCKAGETCPTR